MQHFTIKHQADSYSKWTTGRMTKGDKSCIALSPNEIISSQKWHPLGTIQLKCEKYYASIM